MPDPRRFDDRYDPDQFPDDRDRDRYVPEPPDDREPEENIPDAVADRLAWDYDDVVAWSESSSTSAD